MRHFLKYFNKTSNAHWARVPLGARSLIVCRQGGRYFGVRYKHIHPVLRQMEWKTPICVQYLILAKLLLVNPAENMVTRTGSERGGPRTGSWWAFRVLLIQQRVLAERSATLRSLLVRASQNMINYFGTSEAVNQLSWALDPSEANSIAAAAHLELGLMEHVYGHDDAARSVSDHVKHMVL